MPPELEAVVESEELDQPVEQTSSSDSLRGAIETAQREVTERMRDEGGRFAKAAETAETAPVLQTAAPAAPAEPAAPVVQQAVVDPAQPAPVEPAAVRAPDAWSPAAKVKFSGLDPEIQQEIVRREAEVHKGFTKQDEQRNVGKAFGDVVTPYLPLIRSEGGNPIAAVQDLLQTAYTLRTAPQEQKQSMLIGLANQFGIDLNGVFQRLANGQQAPQVDPQVATLQQQVAQLQQDRNSGQRHVEQQEETQRQQTIESFAADPKNPFFTNVKPEMVALLRDSRAKDLQEAYDMACWARPDIRQILLQQKDQQRTDEARSKVNRARAASVSVSGSPSGGVGAGVSNPNASLRDTIAAAMRESSGQL